MKTLIKNVRLIEENGISGGALLLEDGLIAQVFHAAAPEVEDAQIIDGGGDYAAPGFIDMHTHGAGGADFMDGTAESFVTACRMHLSHGATTILPTTLSGDFSELYGAVDSFRAAKARLKDGPFLPGLHLEGPYFSMAQRGAQDPKYIKDPDKAEYTALLDYAGDDIARWSVAVELPGAMELGDCLRARGVLASIGHSDAEYAHVRESMAHGYTHVTHLYSGMSTITRHGGFRHLGVVESAYALEDLTVELIADGCHLPPELLHMIYRLKGPDKICLITDSLRCTGLDVAESITGSKENGQRIIIEDGVAKMPDRTAFAGSIATADRLLRVMHLDAGVPLADCVKMLSLTPARILKLDGRKGSLAPGKDADVLLLDQALNLRTVICNGRAVS